MHKHKHPLAGKTVVLKLKQEFPEQRNPNPIASGQHYVIEDWWDHLTGKSWMNAIGNIACIQYAFRSGATGLPIDDEVVYGQVCGFGHLVHVSELGEEVL